jgi:hypothetical protein
MFWGSKTLQKINRWLPFTAWITVHQKSAFVSYDESSYFPGWIRISICSRRDKLDSIDQHIQNKEYTREGRGPVERFIAREDDADGISDSCDDDRARSEVTRIHVRAAGGGEGCGGADGSTPCRSTV